MYRQNQIGLILVKIIAIVLATFILLEIATRLTLRQPLELFSRADERALSYQFDLELGWRPEPNSAATISGSRVFKVQHNSLGFRDPEWPEKRPDRTRVVVVGDSFVWGYDVDQSERFTDSLKESLPDWDILNLGVSGYGTDQQYLLLKRLLPKLNPEIILLSFNSNNDIADNCSGMVYGGYYKPYFDLIDGELTLRGVPVERSPKFLLRDYERLLKLSAALRLSFEGYMSFTLRNPAPRFDPTSKLLGQIAVLARDNKARLLVALVEDEPKIQQLCVDNHLECLTVATSDRFPEHGNHWTAAGHREVAKKLLGRLREYAQSNLPPSSKAPSIPSED